MDDESLISLLVLWWRVESEWSPVEGYPAECPSCAGYRTSRQYDDANGAGEIDARGRTARHVGEVVDRIPEPWRTVLYMLARNRATGVDVWISPRIDQQQSERLRLEALERFGECVGG
jgi:hypothetical protein